MFLFITFVVMRVIIQKADMLVRHNSMLLSTIYLVGTAKIVCCREEYSIFPAQDILLVLLKILFFKDDKKHFIFIYI